MSAYPYVPGIAGAVPPMNPENLLRDVSTLGGLENAFQIYGAWHVRSITPAAYAAEEAASTARVRKVFGSSGEGDLARFFEIHGYFASRAEKLNLASHPAFAEAAVRIMRAGLP